MLTSSYYTDQGIFEREQQKIFSKLWIFFGLSNELDGPSRQLRKTVAGQDIIVRETDKQLFAFVNRCPHRGHPIISDDTSRKKLVCPYHGWSFKEDGGLQQIPFEQECYQFSKKTLERISLTKVHVTRIGKLIFVNLADRPVSIDKQFSPALQKQLENISNHFSDFKKLVTTQAFNWKLIQENLRDGLHPFFLHNKTLMQAIKPTLPAAKRRSTFARLQKVSFGGPDVSLTHSFDPSLAGLFEPFPAEGRYHNYLLFPTLHLALADGGYTFVLENYVPTDASETKVEVYFLMSKNSLMPEEKNELFARLEKKAMEIYQEDFQALIDIQSAMQNTDTLYKLGIYENAILRFQSVYLRQLNLIRSIKEFIKNLMWNWFAPRKTTHKRGVQAGDYDHTRRLYVYSNDDLSEK